jgi:hypothetical protein
LLWLFVINLGIAFGAGLYEGRITIANWLISTPDGGVHWNAEAARRDNTGLRFWVFVTTGPLTLLTIANLFGAWFAAGQLRTWWLAASIAALADRVFTFAYFIPTMVVLLQAVDSVESVAIAQQWATLNQVRHALTLTGWVAALKAFALLAGNK